MSSSGISPALKETSFSSDKGGLIPKVSIGRLEIRYR
jgi:hypothetical protein